MKVEKARQFFVNFSYIAFGEGCSVVCKVLQEG